MQGSGLLAAAMREGNEVLLAGYVQALRKRGVPESELSAEYAKLQEQHPKMPTLAELDRKREQAESR